MCSNKCCLYKNKKEVAGAQQLLRESGVELEGILK